MQGTKGTPRAYLAHRRERGPVRGALLSFAFSLLSAALILIITAVLLSYLPSGMPYIAVIGGAEGVALAFFGGLAAGRLGGRGAIVAGVIYGVLYLLTMLLFGYLFPSGGALWKRIIGYAFFLALSVLGGMLGGMRPQKHHRRAHRRH